MEKKYEYRIVGRFRSEEKYHVVGGNSHKFKTKEEAEKELKRLKDDSELEMRSKKCKSNGVVESEYYSDYDLLDLKIQCREITPWADL